MTTLKSRLGSVLFPALPIGRRSFDILRLELRALRRRASNALNPLFHAKVARLNRQGELSLNIGSGGRGLPGWVNIELSKAVDTVICLDIRAKLPFAAGSVSRIFIEHVLEHVDFRQDVPRMLADWRRVLKPGGVVRIIVPDLPRYMAAYLSADNSGWEALNWNIESLPADIFTPMHIVNHAFHQDGEHQFGYDFDTLAWALRRAGFSRVERGEFGRSIDPDLAIDQLNHAHYSLYVDAVK